MKKKLFLFAMIAIVASMFTACTDTGSDDPIVVEGSLLKSTSFYAAWAGGTEKWVFTYDANKKVTKFDNYWDGTADKTVNYDYTVANKVTLKKASDNSIYANWDVNAAGYVTKDLDGNTYEYDANGYLVKYYEYWSNASHLKYEMTIVNGNITRITTYNDNGVTPKKIKEFTYTIGDNTNKLQQTSATDSDWKPIGNFFGKPSAKLVNYFEYWDPQVTPIVKSKSTFTYIFDAKNRVTKATKTLADLTTEVWDYTYWE